MYAIETTNIGKRYGDLVALSNINLNIHKGEFFGCFGPNGAGKTTLLKILTGQTTPTTGTAKVFGIDVCKSPLQIKKIVGIVPEVEVPPSYLTSYEYLYFVGKIRNVKKLDEKIKYWFNFFDIDEKEKTLCKDMSRGMRQKLMISAALLHLPDILFLDEPLVNLDPIYQRKLRDYLANYVKNGGTIFMCSHLLEASEKLCTRVAIINRGKIVAHGKIEDLKTHETESLEEIFLRTVK